MTELPEKTQTLQELIVIDEQMPDDFLENTEKYQKQLDVAIITAKSLVHPLTEQGRKDAKTDVALIRKYSSNTNKFSLSVFRTATDKIKVWRDAITDRTKSLEQEADAIMLRFNEMETKQLNFIKLVVESELTSQRTKLSVRDAFITQADLSPLVKLTGTLTPSQNLTAKATSFIVAIVGQEIANQNRYDARLMQIKLECLEADINPPLSPDYFGDALYGDDAWFKTKLVTLIKIEVDRRAEIEQRIIKQHAAENQRRIDEAIRIENEKHAEIKRQSDQAFHEKVSKQQAEIAAANGVTLLDSSVRSEPPATYQAAPQNVNTLPDKRTVRITAVFEFENISSRVSTPGVIAFFEKQLGDKLKLALKTMGADNVE